MKQSPFKKHNSFSASQEMLCILRNQKDHYLVHKSPLLVRNLSQMNPVHAFPFRFFLIHFNIILSSALRSSKWSPGFRFRHQNLVYIFLSPTRAASRLSHYSWFAFKLDVIYIALLCFATLNNTFVKSGHCSTYWGMFLLRLPSDSVHKYYHICLQAL